MITATRKATDVQAATLNGRKVLLFSVWTLIEGAWIFSGRFSAPARTPKRGLLAHSEVAA